VFLSSDVDLDVRLKVTHSRSFVSPRKLFAKVYTRRGKEMKLHSCA